MRRGLKGHTRPCTTEEVRTSSHNALGVTHNAFRYDVYYQLSSTSSLFRPPSISKDMLKTRFINSKRFRDNDLIYLHCLSEHDFLVFPRRLCWVQLSCREIHSSFIDEMDIRIIVLVPANLAYQFDGVRSPYLVRLKSSCDVEVSSEIEKPFAS